MQEFDYKKIEKIIHYGFKNKDLLKMAFTHSSYANDNNLPSNQRLEYLGDSVKYTVGNDRIIVTIDVHKNEILLLDNIEFYVNDDLQMVIHTNTKSSDVIPLTVGDSYTDGEFMMRMKNNGYSCK